MYILSYSESSLSSTFLFKYMHGLFPLHGYPNTSPLPPLPALFYSAPRSMSSLTYNSFNVCPSFICSVKPVRSEVAFYTQLCYMKSVIKFGFRNQ